MNSPNAKPVRYLSASELYNINDLVTDGHTFVRDLHLLNSAARRPSISLFGEPQFPTIYDKAAALLESLAYHHLFADGNKRTALRAVVQFLTLNGYRPAWTETEQYDFILEVAQGKLGVEQIAAWLAAHTEVAG
ncbi:MAG: type II toxin-antitoxin system death-on-curing family toxin [Chloroflexota bacterium]|nr:type II toxin-antitoxin system death-on-curing family toxin [Chloroflexota bacterium]